MKTGALADEGEALAISSEGRVGLGGQQWESQRRPNLVRVRVPLPSDVVVLVRPSGVGS